MGGGHGGHALSWLDNFDCRRIARLPACFQPPPDSLPAHTMAAGKCGNIGFRRNKRFAGMRRGREFYDIVTITHVNWSFSFRGQARRDAINIAAGRSLKWRHMTRIATERVEPVK